MPDRVKSLREVDCSKNRLRDRFEFIKPIWNELKNKILSRVVGIGQKPAWWGTVRMELDSRKKSRRDRMMLSKSFEIQVRNIG